MVVDPVCGMKVDPDESDWVMQHEGDEYFFCSARCQEAFMRDPTVYTEMRHEGPLHSRQGGHAGGCCGGGMGGGGYSYVHLAIMIALMILLLIR
jgi:YHS domain-containing protein